MRTKVLAEKRHVIICQELKAKKFVTVSYLVERLNVTDETIRTDLKFLEKQGRVVKLHGGARAVSDAIEVSEVPVSGDAPRIHWACNQIKPGELIFLDNSQDSHDLAMLLPEIPISVVTNSPKIAVTLSDRQNVNLEMIGGKYDRIAQCFLGEAAPEPYCQPRFDRIFFSCDGMSTQMGLQFASERKALFISDLLMRTRNAYALQAKELFSLDMGNYSLKKGYASITVVTDADVDKSFADNMPREFSYGFEFCGKEINPIKEDQF